MREVQFDRFYVDEADFDEYREIETAKNAVLKNHPEVFMLAACIGYELELRLPLSKPKQLTQKTSVLNLENGTCLYEAFKVITSNNNEVDDDGNVKVNAIIQEYANGGFKKLKQILGEAGSAKDNLLNYIMLHVDIA